MPQAVDVAEMSGSFRAEKVQGRICGEMHMIGLPRMNVAPGRVVEFAMTDSALLSAAEAQTGPGSVALKQESQFATDRSIRWEAVTTEICGRIDLGILRRALEEFVRRHDTLRSIFKIGNGVAQRHVLEPADVALRCVDVGPLGSTPEVRDYFKNLFGQITPRRWPAYMFAAVVRDSNATLLLAFDHIHVDLSSLALTVSEIQELYEAGIHDRPAELPAVGSHAYFSEAERSAILRRAPDTSILIDYWSDFLSRCEVGAPSFPLPLGAAGDSAAPQAAEEVALFNEEVAREFETWCLTHGGTFFSGLLAVIAQTSHRIAGIDSFRAIAPFHNRDAANDSSIGWFAAGGPIEIRIEQGSDLVDILRSAHSATRLARRCASLPFEIIETELSSPVQLEQAFWMSYIDFRRFAGAENYDLWKATVVCHERMGTGADIWVNRGYRRTYAHLRFPDNETARVNVHRLVFEVGRLIESVASQAAP